MNQVIDQSNLKNLQNLDEALARNAFLVRLKNQVLLVTNTRLFAAQQMSACGRADEFWFSRMGTDRKKSKDVCQQLLQKTREQVKENWSSMRVQLALAQPERKENQISNWQQTWLTEEPQHTVTEFAKLPRLNQEEVAQARKIYLQNLDLAAENFGLHGVSQALTEGQPSHKIFSRFEGRVVLQQEKLRKQHLHNYHEILAQTPVMAFLSQQDPSDSELAVAHEKIVEKLKANIQVLEQMATGIQKGRGHFQAQDWSEFMKFDHIVEQILKESPQFCATATKLKRELDDQRKKNMYTDMGVALLVSTPCLIVGPVGAASCLLAGGSMAAVNLQEAHIEKDRLLAKTFSTHEAQDFASLETAKQEIYLREVLLPVALWGRVGVLPKVSKGNLLKTASNKELAKSPQPILSNAHQKINSRPSLSSLTNTLETKISKEVISIRDNEGIKKYLEEKAKDTVEVLWFPNSFTSTGGTSLKIARNYAQQAGGHIGIRVGDKFYDFTSKGAREIKFESFMKKLINRGLPAQGISFAANEAEKQAIVRTFQQAIQSKSKYGFSGTCANMVCNSLDAARIISIPKLLAIDPLISTKIIQQLSREGFRTTYGPSGAAEITAANTLLRVGVLLPAVGATEMVDVPEAAVIIHNILIEAQSLPNKK